MSDTIEGVPTNNPSSADPTPPLMGETGEATPATQAPDSDQSGEASPSDSAAEPVLPMAPINIADGSAGESEDHEMPEIDHELDDPARFASADATKPTRDPQPSSSVPSGTTSRPTGEADDEMPEIDDGPGDPDGSAAAGAVQRTRNRSMLAASFGFRQEAEPLREESEQERSVSSGVEINVGGAVGGSISVSSGGEDYAYDEVHNRVVKALEIGRAEKLFVPSTDVEETLRDLRLPTGGLCLIVGPDHSGKYMTALNLAQRLGVSRAGQGDELTVCCYTNPIAGTLSLPRFVGRAPEKRIYIIRDAFEHGYSPQRMLAEYNLIVDILRRREIYLILTSEESAASFAEIISPMLEIDRPAMDKVLQSHLAYYENYYDDKLVTVLRDLLPRVAEILEYPNHSDLFFTRLAKIASDDTAEDLILETARRVARVGRSEVRAWFQNLSKNQRLYALFVGLFSGIKGPLLDILYFRAIDFLRRDGLTELEDPRSAGIADIREQINVNVDLDRRLPPDLDVTFSQSEYAWEVYAQISNYNLTLWSIRGVLMELMREYSAPEFWRFRHMLASALGVVCAAHPERLLGVLNELALDRSRPVVATAGSVMAEACRREPARRHDVLNLLGTWIKSQRPALMWAAGAAVWRVYPDTTTEADDKSNPGDSFRTNLMDTLKLLGFHAKQISEAERLQLWERCRASDGDPRAAFISQIKVWQKLNYSCFIYAVERIMALDPVSMSDHLERWMLDRNGLLAWLSRRASLNLFLNGRDPDDRFPVEQQNQMLRLIHPLLKSGREADHGPTEEALETVRLWLEWGASDPETIVTSLLPIANDQDPQISFLVRRSLANLWLDSGCKEAQLIAQRLIGRSVALQGWPIHPPGAEQGVLVLDGSSRGMAEGISARAAVLLRALLDSQLETSLVLLGRDERLAGPEEPVSTNELRRRVSRSRLLIPALESLEERRISLLLILSWGEVLDRADLPGCLDVDDIRLVAAGYQPSEGDSLDVFRVSSAISWTDLHSLEVWLIWTRARRIATCDFSRWQPDLEHHLGLTPDQDPTDKLDEWAARLDEASGAAGKDDLVRLVNTAFMWWLDTDPETCLGLLSTWLGKDDPESPHRLAIAAGRQIFFVLAHRKTVLRKAIQESLLRCASDLVTSGWFGAEAVFYLARHLLPQPQWQRLLIDGTGSYSQPLATWFAALTPKHEQLLRDLLDMWEHRLIEEEAPPAILSEIIPWLRLRISLSSGNLQELIGNDEQYFVIAIDGAPPNQAIRKHICDLTRGVAGLLEKKSQKVLVHRIGLAAPVAMADEEISDESLYPPGLQGLSRLVSPIAESHDVNRVVSLLLILFDDVVDGADLGDSRWVERIKVYDIANRASDTLFFRVPPGDVESLVDHLLTT